MRRVLSETDLKDFRDRVCSAAAELLAELGYDGFNMRELASRLGVSAMTTYRYFESKEEIFAALRAQAFSRLADRLEHLASQPGSAVQRFVAYCEAYLDFAREDPVRYELMFDQSPGTSACSMELAHARRRVFQALIEEATVHSPADTDPERLAQSLWASLHGIASLTVMGAFREDEVGGLVRDVACRFAGAAGGSTELNQRVVNPTTEPHRSWNGRPNGAPLSGWVPVAAAD